ncbi:MAG: hypothetical protein AB7W59_06100 [Acidimicrobiia bacterium]
MTGRAPLPDRFLGAWRRESLELPDAGGGPFEKQRVLWLQAASAFADVRVPLAAGDPDPQAAPVSFAGVTSWDGRSLCWHRDLDLHRVTEADEGEITWDGTSMIETGSFTFGGVRQPYREVWVRDDAVVLPRLALRSTDDTARLVQVGDHAITVADERSGRDEGHGRDGRSGRDGGWYRACYRRRVDGAWQEISTVGDHAAALPPPPAIDGVEPGDTIRYGGRVWLVEECTSA